MKPVSVLIVDDNKMLADALVPAVARDPRFHAAGWVSDPQQVVDRVREAAPDIVLMDIDLPGADSFAIVRSVCASVPAARVVMFSGHLRDEYLDAAIDAGAHGYLLKDETLSELFTHLLRVHEGQVVFSDRVVEAMRRT